MQPLEIGCFTQQMPQPSQVPLDFLGVAKPQRVSHPPAGGHLGCSQFGAIINKAAIKYVQGFVWTQVVISEGQMPSECDWWVHGGSTEFLALPPVTHADPGLL